MGKEVKVGCECPRERGTAGPPSKRRKPREILRAAPRRQRGRLEAGPVLPNQPVQGGPTPLRGQGWAPVPSNRRKDSGATADDFPGKRGQRPGLHSPCAGRLASAGLRAQRPSPTARGSRRSRFPDGTSGVGPFSQFALRGDASRL